MIRFLEANGFDVTYWSGIDTHRRTAAELAKVHNTTHAVHAHSARSARSVRSARPPARPPARTHARTSAVQTIFVGGAR